MTDMSPFFGRKSIHSISGVFVPQAPYRGFAPWPHWGTCIPQTSWLGPFWKIPGSTCEPLYCKILGSPMACAHAELENVLLRTKERPLNFWSRPRMTLLEIAPNKRLMGAIGRHGGFTVVFHNNRRNVFLWRPLNYTLPYLSLTRLF